MTVPTVLPQIVPSRACLQCDVCCRFPDPDSALRPYFTEREIEMAGRGLAFHNLQGSQVALVPDPQGEGYLCPAFDVATSQCHIYEQRPLDCQLYPLALMWNETHDRVLLGWDTKCPFMRDAVPEAIRQHADRVMALLAQSDIREQLASHPRLIGGFQEDVIVLAPLPDVTAAVAARWGSAPLHRLTVDDLPRMTKALERSGLVGPQSPAAYSPVYHYMSHGLLAYWWMELHGAFCLFAQSPDGWFLPVLPLGAGSVEVPLAEAMALLHRWNGDSPVSRVENVPSRLAPELERLGYRLTPKEPDYLYQAADLAALAGDRYKSQRALCNRFEREQSFEIGDYHERDRRDCRLLLKTWASQKQAGGVDGFGAMLLADAESVHEIMWAHAQLLRLTGLVVRIHGQVCAYTFGYWLTDETFCVLLEVADRAYPGLAQYLFRETCRMALAKGARYINTMDDAGLPGLRESKQAYHPVMLIPGWIASCA